MPRRSELDDRPRDRAPGPPSRVALVDRVDVQGDRLQTRIRRGAHATIEEPSLAERFGELHDNASGRRSRARLESARVGGRWSNREYHYDLRPTQEDHRREDPSIGGSTARARRLGDECRELGRSSVRGRGVRGQAPGRRVEALEHRLRSTGARLAHSPTCFLELDFERRRGRGRIRLKGPHTKRTSQFGRAGGNPPWAGLAGPRPAARQGELSTKWRARWQPAPRRPGRRGPRPGTAPLHT